jgi:hypothetical protein
VNRRMLSLGTATLLASRLPPHLRKTSSAKHSSRKAIEGNFAEISMGDLAQKKSMAWSRMARCFPQTTPPPTRRLWMLPMAWE